MGRRSGREHCGQHCGSGAPKGREAVSFERARALQAIDDNSPVGQLPNPMTREKERRVLREEE